MNGFINWTDHHGKPMSFPVNCGGFPPACLKVLISAQAKSEKKLLIMKRNAEEKDDRRSDPRPW